MAITDPSFSRVKKKGENKRWVELEKKKERGCDHFRIPGVLKRKKRRGGREKRFLRHARSSDKGVKEGERREDWSERKEEGKKKESATTTTLVGDKRGGGKKGKKRENSRCSASRHVGKRGGKR